MIIEIDEYPVMMKLGWRQEERYQYQRVLVSLRVHLAKHLGCDGSDALDQTMDYGSITHRLCELLEDQECLLLETIVCKVGRALLGSFIQIEAVEVCVEKTQLPQAILKTARVRCRHTFKRDTV